MKSNKYQPQICPNCNQYHLNSYCIKSFYRYQSIFGQLPESPPPTVKTITPQQTIYSQYYQKKSQNNNTSFSLSKAKEKYYQNTNQCQNTNADTQKNYQTTAKSNKYSINYLSSQTHGRSFKLNSNKTNKANRYQQKQKEKNIKNKCHIAFANLIKNKKYADHARKLYTSDSTQNMHKINQIQNEFQYLNRQQHHKTEDNHQRVLKKSNFDQNSYNILHNNQQSKMKFQEQQRIVQSKIENIQQSKINSINQTKLEQLQQTIKSKLSRIKNNNKNSRQNKANLASEPRYQQDSMLQSRQKQMLQEGRDTRFTLRLEDQLLQRSSKFGQISNSKVSRYGKPGIMIVEQQFKREVSKSKQKRYMKKEQQSSQQYFSLNDNRCLGCPTFDEGQILFPLSHK